jgi:hypothetical protein
MRHVIEKSHYARALIRWSRIKFGPLLKPADQWTKFDLINFMARQHGYRSYLELCTYTTGNYYAYINKSLLPISHRLMYRCGDDYDDGMVVDFRAIGDDISECLTSIRERGLRYDIILVDSWHEYGTSLRDLREAWTLLAPTGTIVVHDCFPPSAEMAAPLRNAQMWSGVSYKAYFDFVIAQQNADYRTVDTDYGCGIIRKRSTTPSTRRGGIGEYEVVTRAWHLLGNNYDAAFLFMQDNKNVLSNLRTVKDFILEEKTTSAGRRLGLSS